MNQSFEGLTEAKGPKADRNIFTSKNLERSNPLSYDIKGNSFKSTLIPATTVANAMDKNRLKASSAVNNISNMDADLKTNRVQT